VKIDVLMDDQAFMLQERGGVSRYYVELIREFRRTGSDVNVHTPFKITHNRHLAELSPTDYRVATGPLLGQPRLLRMINRLSTAAVPRIDVVHHTFYFGRPRVPRGAASVVTIYDMIPELFPDYFGRIRAHREKRDYVRQADAIICISEQTRQDLLELYGDPGVPVTVTPLAISVDFARDAVPVPAPLRPYLLFVGTRSHYKNFGVVLDALGLAETGALDLICVGGGAFTGEEWSKIGELGLAARVSQRVVGDAELAGLYGGAMGFIFPSRYEGFGLPILEAFSMGCPVLLADTPIFREVADDAALYFSADGPEELSALIDQLAETPSLGATLSASGRARATRFSWERTAALTADVYRSVCD
jgi:glycosyltransferase involved in cell wall biosynthesis